MEPACHVDGLLKKEGILCATKAPAEAAIAAGAVDTGKEMEDNALMTFVLHLLTKISPRYRQGCRVFLARD
jgi:hypothetical protein